MAEKKRRPFSEEARQNMSDGQKGRKHPHTEESKRLIGLKSKGRRHTQETKKAISEKLKVRNLGVGNPSYGRKQSREMIEKRVSQYRGDKNCKWKGGRDSWWRAEVKKRDDNTCQKCGMRDPDPGFMEADHILEKSIAPGLRYDIGNGETLCPNCHKRKTLGFKRVPKTKAKLRELYP